MDEPEKRSTPKVVQHIGQQSLAGLILENGAKT
jgi:hypothetical protein